VGGRAFQEAVGSQLYHDAVDLLHRFSLALDTLHIGQLGQLICVETDLLSFTVREWGMVER